MEATKLVTLAVAFCLSLLILQPKVVAQNADNTLKETLAEKKAKSTELKYQSDNVTNQIPYFDNRFRIDAELDELTLIFYRKRGSKPIILVRPDGSKLRVNNFDHDKVQWHDDSTFDLIKIKKPMVGPWQAIGDISPDSQILVVSDVKIEVDPLPEIVLEGETLKVVGKLVNGEEDIESPLFRNVVKLDVHFYSTNNSLYDNFGAEGIKVTSFRDDGDNLDEYANDNIFTGEFELDFAPGEWQPVYLVKLPMITRELRQQPILLHETPISIAVETSELESIPHTMILTIDPTHVVPDSLIFQGKVTFPDKQVEPFSIMEGQGETREKEIRYTEGGLHRISLSAFGETTTGREFRLTVPEFSFNVKSDIDAFVPTFNVEEGDERTQAQITEQMLAEKEAALAEAKLAQQLAEEEEQMQTMIIIGVSNAVIIILALVVFFVMRRKKKK